jgi:hypothetical protein
MIFELTKKIMKKFNNDNNKTDRTLKTWFNFIIYIFIHNIYFFINKINLYMYILNKNIWMTFEIYIKEKI